MGKGVEATIYTETGSPALIIEAVSRRGDKLVIEGKALGSIYMDMLLSAKDFPRLLRVVCSWGLISFLLLLPYFALASAVKRLSPGKMLGRPSRPSRKEGGDR
jgi:hypothetical protein